MSDRLSAFGAAAILILCASAPLLASASDATTRYHAKKESTELGQRSGSKRDTRRNDGNYEGITEELNAAGTSALEHTWRFKLGLTAERTVLNVQAHHTINSEGDAFRFELSLDQGASWQPLLTLEANADTDAVHSAVLPNGDLSDVRIRVTDTDRRAGNVQRDTLYVDALWIEARGMGNTTTYRAPVEPAPSLTYQAATMDEPLGIEGYQPSQAGTYPAAIWLTGTFLSPWSEDDEVIVQQMAARGYVAVSVDYSTRGAYPSTCEGFRQTAAQVFDVTDPNSAINQLANNPKVDLSKGIVVWGFSQGANHSAQAKNFDPRIRAAYLLGHGYQNPGRECLGAEHVDLPGNRMRAAMGLNDTIFNSTTNPDSTRTMQEHVTGFTCGDDATQCLQPNGSGWYLVPKDETVHDSDEHCFWYGQTFNAIPGVDSAAGLDTRCGAMPLEPNWLDGDHWWSGPPSFDWLASWGDVRVAEDGTVLGATPREQGGAGQCLAE